MHSKPRRISVALATAIVVRIASEAPIAHAQASPGPEPSAYAPPSASASTVGPAASGGLGSLAVTPTGYGGKVYVDKYGYSFRVSSPVRVTALAAYAYDSLDAYHTPLSKCVTLWRDSLSSLGYEFQPPIPAQFIAEAVVSPGDPKIPFRTSDGFHQHHTFACSAIEPVVLSVGPIYVVSLSTMADPNCPSCRDFFLSSTAYPQDSPPPAFVSGPEIVPLLGRYAGGACGFPRLVTSFSATTGAYFGANFLYEVVAPTDVTPDGTSAALVLSPPTPNPMTGRSDVSYTLRSRSLIHLALMDAQGREVAVLADGILEAGRHTTSIEAARLRPGIYFVTLRSRDAVLTRRMAVLN